jgi:hypothetical protein
VRSDGGSVAGQEVFIFTHADNEGRAASGPDHDLGIIRANDGDPVGADHFAQGVHHGFGQRVQVLFGRGTRRGLSKALADLVVVSANQSGEHLGVGRRLERLAFKAFLETVEVFDHAVMDHRDPAAGVIMRVRILVGRRSMRGPTGVTNP